MASHGILASMKTSFLVALFLFLTINAFAQELRIASYNMERLGQGKKDYPTLARVVASFDVVAVEEVMNPQGAADVLAQLGVGWADYVSTEGEGSRSYQEHFGFFYDGNVVLVRTLGEYPTAQEFFRPPFGVEFRDKATGFTFNLVACHIVYGSTAKARKAEIAHLAEVYRYFEDQTGDAGETIIVGDFNDDRALDFASLAAVGERDVIPDEGTTMGLKGPDHWYDHIFVPAAMQPRVKGAGPDYWTTDYPGSRNYESDHFPVFVVLEVSE
jgi:endonuclease/exonuclease/phosphatase family metal-dependent hydrolase